MAHHSINLFEVFVVVMALEDILSVFDALVEFAHVISHPDGTIFLLANETWYAKFSIIDSEAEANGALKFHFLLIGRNAILGDEIRRWCSGTRAWHWACVW
jgi:hypothetical protein